jgi:two-component system, LytTR family, sensor histidine kinase AlgZ
VVAPRAGDRYDSTVALPVRLHERGARPRRERAPHEMPGEGLGLGTLRALAVPRRLVPILIVVIPLVVLQARLSSDRRAGWIGLLLCLAFLLVAPPSYRLLFPRGVELPRDVLRLALYGVIGAGVISLFGVFLPDLFSMRPTLMTARSSLVVCLALFFVGGWGLGRDIDMEARLEHEQARARLLAREAEHAQLLALRSHLDPHFLFNTLQAIAEWCREDGEVAERAVLQLSSMLRAMLAAVKSSCWPLGSELELLASLFELHLLREPTLFELRVDVPEALRAAPIPTLLLLPLAENAVKHGPAAGFRGRIEIVAREDGGRLVITLANPGPYRGPRPGSDGVPMVERRLALAYEGRAELRISGGEGRTEARLTVPLEEAFFDP